VFENRMLRRISGPETDEVTGGRRKLHNEELHNLYFLPHVIRINKSRRIIWVEHVEGMDAMRNAYRVFVGKQEEKSPLWRTRNTDWRIILKWILKK
jgi:hypothetical protein